MIKQPVRCVLGMPLVWGIVFLITLSVLKSNGIALDSRDPVIVQAAITNPWEERVLLATSPGNVINVPSCARSDIQAAVALAQDGDTLRVPAGSCTWSSSITIHDKSITVIGPGKDNITITVMDIGLTLTASPGGSNASRISGFRFDMTNGTYGVFLLCDEGQGCAQNWRVDHNEFINNSDSSKVTIFGYVMACPQA